MRIVMFYHSLVSDWNHGNAHFLRGVATEVMSRGHSVDIWEPADGWSRRNLLDNHGNAALQDYQRYYPSLSSSTYQLPLNGELSGFLRDADVVLVHEWNDPALVAAIGAHHKAHPSYLLLFHDTHHRAVSAPHEMDRMDLSGYDGVLAFGESLRSRYQQSHPHLKAFTWHEAADTRLFRPLEHAPTEHEDLIWVGNWGDDERTEEIHKFLLAPAARLRLRGSVYGVRYPQSALSAVAKAGLSYCGWAPNYRIPDLFAKHALTVHIPRRPYVEYLPGIPTIRIFEALACGIALISAPWNDAEHLFEPGKDFLVARNGEEMETHISELLRDASYRRAIADRGRQTILNRHTCAHRVDELMEIIRSC